MDNRAEQFKQLLKILSANYNRTLTEPQVGLLKVMANQYGFNDCNSAIMAHMNDPEHGMYFPNMAHVARQIKKLPKKNMIENKGSLSWCDDTQKLLDEYGAGSEWE